MNFYFTKRICVFSLTILLLSCHNIVSAQCGFSALNSSGCEGFYPGLQDTTSGINCGSTTATTNWLVILPPGCNPDTLYTYRNCQFQLPLNCAGTVDVIMTDTINGTPCRAQGTLTVYPNPVIQGYFSTEVTCAGACVYWNDNSIAGAGCTFQTFAMDWKNSQPIDPTRTPPVCETFAQNGVYSPSILIINSCGCQASTTMVDSITVAAPPSAAFTGTPLSSCTSPLVSTMTVTTPAPGATYTWYVSSTGSFTTPSQSSTSTTFVHSYPAGTYSVMLIASYSSNGCADTTVQTNYVTAGAYPAACFTANDSTGCSNRYIQFCPCPSGITATSYDWYYTGGAPGSFTPTSSTNQSNVCQSVYYYNGGTFTVQEVVNYPGGCTSTASKTFTLGTIYNLDFTAPDSTSCLIPESVCVTYTGQACPSCTFLWSPPGNLTPNNQSGTCYPITAYGPYSPELQVTDTTGCQSTLIKTNYINVNPLVPCVNVSYLHGNGCANDTIVVTNCTAGGPFSNVAWNFPGANVVSQNNNQAQVIYSATGCNDYSMIVRTASGCIDTLRDSICIAPKPTVGMSISPNDMCYGTGPVIFTPTESAPYDTTTTIKVWPEGIRSAVTFTMPDLDSTAYIYQDFGNFSFCYVASTLGCLGDTICDSLMAADSVYIYPPIPKIAAQPICSNGSPIVFINKSVGTTSYSWTYNGTTYPNQDTLTITAPPCGTKVGVTLTAINDTVNLPAGCITTIGDTVIMPCYETDFRFWDTTGCTTTGYESPANIFQTVAGGLIPTSVFWSAQLPGSPPVFGNPAYSGDTMLPGYLLNNPGLYTACAQLTYANGCRDTLCKSNYIDISDPIASFTVSDSEGCVPFCVQFTNTSTDNSGFISHYTWNFSDTAGRVDSVDVNPDHCFDILGQFQVCLNITDTNGCTSSYCKMIQANIINANFSESDSFTCPANNNPDNPITYTNTSTGFVSTYQWILPASLGTTIVSGSLTSPSITLQYANTGTDSVGLVAIDASGSCRDTVFKPVTVANPIANYGVSDPADTVLLCPPLLESFYDSSLNDICTYSWNFGDGGIPETNQNPGHLWTIPGTYPVTETVTSCHGCVDSITRYTFVIQGPHVSISANTTGGCPCLPVTFIITSWQADALQITSGGGSPLFINLDISPRGTAANPAYDTVSFVYCNVGDIRPSILAIDSANNCAVPYDSLIHPIPVDTPTVNFSYTRVCGTDSICFSNLTTFASIYAYDSSNNWNFGDGTSSSSFSPCHVYPGPGDYSVTLQVFDQFLCIGSLTQNVHVAAPPVAAYTFSDSIGCKPLLLPFVDSSTVDDSTTLASGQWNFGNGVMSGIFSGLAPNGDTVYDYTSSGTYVTSLIITDGYGCSDTATHTISVLDPPSDSIGPNQTICRGSTATLYGSGSEPIAWITNYNISDTSSMTPQVWPARDTFYILSVGSPTTCYKYDTVYIFVDTIAISLDTATNLCRNELTTFTATASSNHGSISTYDWTFGDGSAAATGQTVTHQYSTYGSYTDTLIVINNIGCSDTDITPLVIFDIPHAAMSVSDTVVCLGTPITLTNLSTPGASGALTTFYFGLQDGLPNDTSSPYIVLYPQPGSYDILLVQTDANGCLDSAEQNVIIHALPQSNFNNDTSCVNVYNTYTSSTILGDGPITTYDWTVNGTDMGVDSSTVHYTFADSSSNQICLKVTDVYGCQGDTCKNVQIFSNPQITVTPLDTTLCLGYSSSFVVTGARFSSVQWVPSAWVSDPTADSVVITPLQTIRYQVYGYYLQCQPAIDTVSIYVMDTVPITATADPENIVLGLSSNVTSTVQGTIDSIVWDPSSTLNCRNCPNPIATPTQTTTYYATVYYHHQACSTCPNEIVCSNKTSVTITVYQSCDNSLIYVPNTFTPDNINGKNTVFRLQGIGIKQVNYLRVYDRWGKLVYQDENEADPNHAAWNGGLDNDTNRPENSGVFVYVFEIQCVTGQTVTGKGNITLIR